MIHVLHKLSLEDEDTAGVIILDQFVHPIDVYHVVHWLGELPESVLSRNYAKFLINFEENEAESQNGSDRENEDNWSNRELSMR